MTAAGIAAAALLVPVLVFGPPETKMTEPDPGDRCMVQVEFQEAVEKPAEPEPESVQENVQVSAPAPVNGMHLWGVCTITHYCPCEVCCSRANAPTASGVMPTVNHTVACGDLPFGTRLMINGQQYVVEDRGVSGFWVDIFVAGHQEAYDRGMFQAEVYIIDG